MDILLALVKVTLEEGFVYAVLAMGVYITYSILDFPDLSVDGTLPFGAIISGVLILQGWNPWLCLLVSFLGGAAAGCIAGFLHVRLHIRPLLCGILVMTGLLTINLVLAKAGTGGLSIVSFTDSERIFNSGIAELLPESIGGLRCRALILSLVLAVLCKLALDWYLSTKSGLLLRATGNNEQYVVMLGRNPGNMKILGLALGNGFAALAGAILAQQNKSASTAMGTGMVVLGLASVIIGLSLFQRVRRMRATTKVLLGSIVYKACLAAASGLGLPTDYLKLLMAVLFVLALVGSDLMKRQRRGRT